MLPPAILAELRAALDSDGSKEGAPQSGLITAPNQLQTYECDGLTAFRVMPAAVVLPRTTDAGSVRHPHLRETQHPLRRPRRRHRPQRRCAPRRRLRRHQPRPHEPHPQHRSSQPAGHRPARRHQLQRHRRRLPAGLLLRARPQLADPSAPSAATSPRTPAEPTASSTASPSPTSSR